MAKYFDFNDKTDHAPTQRPVRGKAENEADKSNQQLALCRQSFLWSCCTLITCRSSYKREESPDRGYS